MQCLYERLPAAPPVGPVVRSRMAPALRLCLRVFNVLLAAVGLLITGAAAVMDWQYKHGSRGGSDAPLLPAISSLGSAAGVSQAAQASDPATARLARSMLSSAAAAAAVGSKGGSSDGWAWPIYAVGCLGLYLLLTAFTGLSAGCSKLDSRRSLASYIALLAVLVLAQAAAMLLLLTDNAWRARLPADPSGCWEATQKFIQANGQSVRLGALAAVGVELLALAAACWLHSIYQTAYEDWLDDATERRERVTALLDRAVQQSYAGEADGTWARRLRAKYGVNTSAVEANANAARQMAVLQDDPL